MRLFRLSRFLASSRRWAGAPRPRTSYVQPKPREFAAHSVHNHAAPRRRRTNSGELVGTRGSRCAGSPARGRCAQRAERALCAKRRSKKKETKVWTPPARDRTHHPGAHSSRSELRAPEGLFATSRMMPRTIGQPGARQRPCTTFAHGPRSHGGRRVPRGRMRSMGGTQLSWETIYPPRLSARRQTTTTSRLAPEPRARRPRRRRR